MSIRRMMKIFSRFIIINMIFFLVTSPFVVLYGPFENIRNATLGAVASSMHRYLLDYILGPDEVNKLIANVQNVEKNINEKVHGFDNAHSTNVKYVAVEGTRFKGYLLEISDPTRVQIGISEKLGEKGETTSEIAKQCGAVAAVNAGGFDDPSGTGNGRIPIGVIIHQGKFLAGGDIKGKVNLVGLNKTGSLITGSYTLAEMNEMEITEGITFSPPLIINGQKLITHGDGGWGIGPRTAIGQKLDGTILLLVIDGRQPQYSFGATLLDVQNILYENGAYVAANLDGGSSSTMYYDNKVVNRPCDLLGERSIPTAFVVK